MSAQLFDGKSFRALTMVDNFRRKCHAIEVNQSLKRTAVVNIVNKKTSEAGILPERI